jgi:hypothetical protein
MKPQPSRIIEEELMAHGFEKTAPNEFCNRKILLHLIEPGICCIIQETPANSESYLDIPKLKYVNWGKLKIILKAVYAIN